MSLTSREVNRLAVFRYPPHMRSVISTLAMLRYRVRAPTFVSSSSSSCCRKSRQKVPTRLDSLPFPAPPICHQIAHHAAYFLPFLVGTHEFCATCVRFQEREKFWNDGLMYVFCRFREKKRQIFRASALFWHAWRGDFADDLSRFCILSYSRVCCKLLVISL